MMPKNYALGLDYGTESGRVMLVDADTGEEVAWKVVAYSRGVMDRALPDGSRLGPDWALQDPRDYITVLREGVPATLEEAGVSGEQVVGVGVDFTASTPLPAKADGTPLCEAQEFSGNPHAWVKLWKHHAAEPQANRINQVAAERDEPVMALYRGGYSSEWMISKALETLEEAPDVYAAADRFLEACDWLVTCTAANAESIARPNRVSNSDSLSAASRSLTRPRRAPPRIEECCERPFR